MSELGSKSGKKKGRRKGMLNNHSEEVGEPWLMSYADFMTLMCSFFILMISMASFDNSKINKLAVALAKYFNEKQMQKLASNLESIKKALEDDIQFTALKNTGLFKMQLTDNGLEITYTGSALFDSGKADILPQAAEQLDVLINLIKTKNKNFRILVEGHTDNAPVKKGYTFTSNRDLSSARASRIVDRFEAAGFDATNLLAIGYGSTRPMLPNENSDGSINEENRKLNRRVVIKILEPKPIESAIKIKEGQFFDDTKVLNNNPPPTEALPAAQKP